MAEGNIELDEILAIQARRASEESEAAKLAAAEKKESEAVRQRIIEGESTGNKLRDLVIVRTGRVDEEALDLYTDLQLRVQDHVGEPVLVVHRDEERTSFHGPGYDGPENGVLVTNIGLGVITSESLVVDAPKGKWAFPTQRYAVNPGDFRSKPRVVEGI